MGPADSDLVLAFQLHKAGRLADAEKVYRQILTDAPKNPDALHLLGVLALQVNRLSEAISLISQALAAYGPHHEFHNNLSAAYLQANRLAEAETECRAALRLKPDFADARNNLGMALRGQGRVEESAAEFREAVRVHPTHADAHCNLGGVLHVLGSVEESLYHLQRAVELAPRHVQGHTHLAGALLGLGKIEQAVWHLREAIRIQPLFIAAHSNLGLALERMNRFDESMQAFEDALRIDPHDVSALLNLGSALQNRGKMAEALAQFQTVLRLEPNNVAAIFNLGKLAAVGYHHFNDSEMQKLCELADRPELTRDNRSRLHFALAQILDKSGAYDEAFAHARKANEMRKTYLREARGIAFDLPALQNRVDALIGVFTPTYFERVRSFGSTSEAPVFIVGMPRSGTSLAEQILASHPQVHGAGELLEIDQMVEALPAHFGGAPYPWCMERMDARLADGLAEEHLHALRRHGENAARIIDKAPFNFFNLGLIATIFPRARIIHCRRNPVDTCLSCFFQNFLELFPFTLDLQHLGQFHREYERLMAYWSVALPTEIFELDYEALTDDAEEVSKRLVAFCGLEWNEACLRFHENERVVRTFSNLQVRQPMYRSSVDRWRRYEAHLQPLMRALGPGTDDSAASVSAIE